MFLLLKSFLRVSSVSPEAVSVTSTAISVFSSICSVFFIRSFPSSPSSSKPGVSIIMTGPAGRSSIDLKTGSVVVPLISETTETSWLVTAFTRLDFPAFRFPKKAIWIRSDEGVLFRLICFPPFSKSEISHTF